MISDKPTHYAVVYRTRSDDSSGTVGWRNADELIPEPAMHERSDDIFAAMTLAMWARMRLGTRFSALQIRDNHGGGVVAELRRDPWE